MAMNGEERIGTTDELLRAHAHVWNHIFAFVSSACLKCAVQLGIPDIIHRHGQPMKLSDLVASLPSLNPSKSHCIRRLMRVLAHDGFFVEMKTVAGEEGEAEYTLTPASHLLLRTTPTSVSPFLLMILHPLMVKPWNWMTSWLGNDDPTPFLTANGRTLWDYAGQNPAFNSLFNEGMESDSRMVASAVIEECRGAFEGLSSLVDVGGGTGTMAKTIAEAFPELKCTVLDLPQVVDKLPGRKNLFFTPGNMFEAIPPANAILLKWILHDWGDEDCVKILRHCREAIPSRQKGGKVIIIDMVVGHQKLEDANANSDKSTQTQLFFDMLMMVLFSSKERTEKEWANLFSIAGFSDYKINPTLGLRSLIEMSPASVSPFLLLMLDPLMVKPLNWLTPWLGNDDPTPFLTTNGQTIWDYADQNPAFNSLVNEGMESESRMVVIEECRGAFEGLSSLVNVGGGTGTMAKVIAKAFLEMKCTVLDLPQVVDKLPGRKNLFFTPGNMFEGIPPANAILLKWILHNWGDEDCVKILRHCKEAIPGRQKGGKVIIIDMVVGHQKLEEANANGDKSTQTQLFFVMLMMALHIAKERTEKEWANLFSVTGFSDYKINPIIGLRSLIEIYP